MFHRQLTSLQKRAFLLHKNEAAIDKDVTRPRHRQQQYSSTPTTWKEHEEQLLQFYASSGALNLDHGPIRIRATACLGDSQSPSVQNDPNTKVIHFQRHAQGYHNLIYTLLKDSEALMSSSVYDTDSKMNPFLRPEMIDAPLTNLGREQCISKRDQTSSLNPELVIVSPLHRTLQTAQITFAEFRGKIPFVAHEGCREELGLLTCNKRRPLEETMREYHDIDFTCISSNEDTLWNPHARECPKTQSKRIYDFLVQFVHKRPERELAIVTHSAWLFNMCHTVLDGPDPTNHLGQWFETSEIRSMILSFNDKYL